MRCMTRNKVTFFYALYDHKEEIIDEYGNATGQYEVFYTDPIRTTGNISPSQGEMQTRQFGDSDIYDKVIILDNPKTLINEHAILWVDTLPTDTNTPHDYIVKKVARSLNGVAIAISKVNVE